MGKFVDRERDPAFLLPPGLRDWIAEDDPAHFAIAAVERVAPGAYYGKRRHELTPDMAS